MGKEENQQDIVNIETQEAIQISGVIQNTESNEIEIKAEEIIPVKITVGTKIKNGIISFCEGIEEIFERVWMRIWNRIQIKLFWVVILTSFGIAIGYSASDWYFQKRVEECIQLGGFIHKTEKFDPQLKRKVPVTEIYDINLRVR
jgi:hypothetical protein